MYSPLTNTPSLLNKLTACFVCVILFAAGQHCCATGSQVRGYALRKFGGEHNWKLAILAGSVKLHGTFGVSVIQAMLPPSVLSEMLSSDIPRAKGKHLPPFAPGSRLLVLLSAIKSKNYDLKHVLPAGSPLQVNSQLGSVNGRGLAYGTKEERII